jgi:hypothetical protein
MKDIRALLRELIHLFLGKKLRDLSQRRVRVLARRAPCSRRLLIELSVQQWGLMAFHLMLLLGGLALAYLLADLGQALSKWPIPVNGAR